MNQRIASADHADDNRMWQDGAILFQLPASSKWTAIFIAFQGQSWNADDIGDPV
jgi:uncharacterized protein YukJ